jgi:hypothetical protein
VWWGPGNPHATTVVAVTLGPDSSSRSSNLSYLHRYFQGQVWICTGLRHPWAQLWPQLRHYD